VSRGVERERPLVAADRPGQLGLVPSRRGEVGEAPLRDRAHPGGRGGVEVTRRLEGREQAVALAEILVEVGQRRDVLQPRVVVHEEREPQPELGQPHGHGVEIHAEQVVADDGAPSLGGRLAGAQRGACLLEPEQRLEEEGAGADGGIEDADGAHRPRVAALERGVEAAADGLVQQRPRREVGALMPPALPRHEALEHAPQHLGIHRVGVVPLAHGEVEALEQLVEQHPPGRVVQGRARESALDRVALEQAAVQEREVAEGARGAGAARGGGVERAEAERVEDRAVEGVAATERCVEERR